MLTKTTANIAAYLPEQARERPHQVAVVKAAGRSRRGRVTYEQLTYAELDRKSDALAWGLAGFGIGRGSRVLLMVPAGLPLIGLTFALFKIGAVPILIDPAMGRQNMAQCIAECAPEALIGVPRAHVLRLVAPTAFGATRRFVVVDGAAVPGSVALDTLETIGATLASPFPIAQTRGDDVAAIAFTTGSTGVPKGVVYEYGMFAAQCNVLRDFYQIAPGEVEMPAFPLFALFNVALGVTSAIPPIDPTRPASCDPAEVVRFIEDQRVSSTFGSPAIWNRVTAYCQEQNIMLPSLKRVLMAGAPVPTVLHERFRTILLPDASTHTPYGATEALPVTSISGRAVLIAHAERNDPTAGTCVGRPVPGVTLRIIPISDAPIEHWGDLRTLPAYKVGEIVVAGPNVTKTYLNRPESTARAKIQDGERIWHRMGDLGYLDDEGRLWFYGRKAHRVETASGRLFSEPVELVFNQHPMVARSALVGVDGGRGKQMVDGGRGTVETDGGRRTADGKQDHRPPSAVRRPVIIVEPKAGAFPKNRAERKRFRQEMLELGARYPMTAGIDTVLFHQSFPVDIRHNAKIFREQLAVWAEAMVQKEG